jgi:hypothetical protein
MESVEHYSLASHNMQSFKIGLSGQPIYDEKLKNSD